MEQVGRLKERFSQAARLATITIPQRGTPQVAWKWKTDAIRAALMQDGAYLLKSNCHGWSPEEFWETYMQLAVAEKAFRTLKSELLIRPIWHQLESRIEAHILVAFISYTLHVCLRRRLRADLCPGWRPRRHPRPDSARRDRN